MNSTPQMESKLQDLAAKGILAPRSENNQYLKVSYKGAGKLVSDKWNIKIYTSGSVVCNDSQTLRGLLDGSLKDPDTTLKVIQCDDAGVGFPLCGVMVGVTDGTKVWTDTVDVTFFQSPQFERQLYLGEYSRKGLEILSKIGAKPETHRIEICTGFINTGLKEALRDKGYDVRVLEIKGLLQDSLEQLFKNYVKKETGQDLAYDPKMVKGSIGQAYYQVLNWGKRNAPHLLKSGWESIKRGQK